MRRRRDIRVLIRCVGGLAGAGLLCATGASPADAASPIGTSAAPSVATEYFSSISAIGPDDVWTVGYRCVSSGECGNPTAALPAAEHWDGSGWNEVAVPLRAGQPDGQLLSVDARTSTDVWAVGSTTAGPLIEHWDGSRWRRVGTQDPTDPSGFDSVTASSSTDVCAVASVAQRALVEHWDGHSWTAQPTPAPGIESSLQDISAASADDVWAVGQWQSAAHPNVIDPLILHWDGTSWLQAAVAGEKSRYNTLYSVSADSAVDAWAIGSAGTRGHRLLRHWDGSSWL